MMHAASDNIIPEIFIPQGFSLLRKEYIEDLCAPAYLLRHDKTHAEILKVAAADENRVFGIGFRTPITASDGRAHILEHAVLGGSRAFPLKDPFFEMIKSSLHTYMNAYTMPDQTVYPVGSVHPRDFLNLMRAYLDAVFQPKLERYTFMREGWHYKQNPDGEGFVYGGIVFNEMKGMYANPSYHLNKAILSSLFPTASYQHDSGGNPAHIVELGYEEFKRFHADHYQPSNSVTILYGAGDLTAELALVKSYMDEFSALAPAQLVAGDPEVFAPCAAVTEFPVQEAAEGQAWVSLAWSTLDGRDPRLTLLEFVSVAIMGFRGAPLYERLERLNLARALRGGHAAYVKKGFFQITFEGTESAKAGEIEAAVLSELETLCRKPLEPQIIEAALHAFEFGIRERANDAERGINVVFDGLTPWLYGSDPFEELNVSRKLASLRETLQNDPNAIVNCIREFFIENKHRVTVTLKPSTTLQANWDAAERKRLDQAFESSDASARAEILADAAELDRRAAQPESAENIAQLPRVRSSELSLTPRIQPLERRGAVTTAPLDPHGIVYTSLSFDIDAMPQEMLPYAVLAARMMFSSDTSKRSFSDLSTEVNRVTGGMAASIRIMQHRTEPRLLHHFTLQARALNRNVHNMTALAKEVLMSAKVTERERVTKLLREYVKRDEQGIVPSANRFAAGRAARGFRISSTLEDELFGVSSVFWMREIAALAESNFDLLASKITEAVKALLSTSHDALVVADDSIRTEAIHAIEQLAAEVGAGTAPRQGSAKRSTATVPADTLEGLSIPSQVNYVARVIDCEAAGLSDHGSNRVFRQLVWGNYLLDRVRFQGGAYGVSAGFDSATRIFKCASYRDPELLETLKVFREIPVWFNAQSLSADDVDRGVIAIIREEDAPQSVYGKASSAYLARLINYTPEREAAERIEVLSTTTKELRRISEIVEAAGNSERICVVGGEEDLKANGFSVTKLVL